VKLDPEAGRRRSQRPDGILDQLLEANDRIGAGRRRRRRYRPAAEWARTTDQEPDRLLEAF
jgi:hypothetical protein